MYTNLTLQQNLILDRCAGTGNLEKFMTEEELSHCILSTIEYYEYKVLLELLGDKVRHIIPPTEHEDTFNMGLVRGADALTKEYLENPVIRQYIDDPKVTVILFENPPYSETTSIEHQKRNKGKNSSLWKNSYVVTEMKKEVKKQATNDLGNAFIWSAFKYYLRQPTDSYIVFSPVKYWKVQHLINKEFINGYAFNRKHFHTNINAMIMCALWANNNKNHEEIVLEAYDIDKSGEIVYENNINISRVHSTFSQKYFDKREFDSDVFDKDGVLCALNGLEYYGNTKRVIPRINNNILGYMAVYSSGFDNPDLKASLLVAGRYDGNGFFLRSDNFLEKLPLFCSSRYITYNSHWTQRSNIMKTGDGSEKYTLDLKKKTLENQLLKCLLFTVLETQNHVRSIVGSDKRYYKNQLCLDNTHGDTIASKKLKNLKLNEQEKKLIIQWELIFNEAKKTKNYNPKLTYGLYQIIEELNTFEINDKKERIFDYPQLNGHIKSLKQLVKIYYQKEIVPFLFEYEFLK